MSFLRTERKILTEFNVILKNGKKPDFTTDKEIEKFILEKINNIEKIEIKSHRKEILKEDFRLIAIASLSKNFSYENKEIVFSKKGSSITVESLKNYTETKFNVDDFFEKLVTFENFYKYDYEEEREKADALATVLKLFALAVRNEANYSIDIKMYSPFNKVVSEFLDPYYSGMQGCIKYSIGKNYVKYYPKESKYEIFVDKKNIRYKTGKEKKNLVFEKDKSEKHVIDFFRELEKEEGIKNSYEIVSDLYNIFRYAEKYEHISDRSLATYKKWCKSLKIDYNKI